ncbi:MAG: hypothetical protein LBI28_01215 [Treponema sp.]|jgi:hypothetical protein|nr:hypothetical protein [Treponema sp.]
MEKKYFMCFLVLASLHCGCVTKNINTDNKLGGIESQEVNNSGVQANKITISQYNSIRREQLEEANLPQPSSLKEIAGRVDDDDRNRIIFIDIDRGENIESLEGMGLFPNLETLIIYKSRIKRITGDPVYNPYFRDIFIESDDLEDISDIVLFKNMERIGIKSNSLNYFPSISHMENLRWLSIEGKTGIIFNKLKLPSNIRLIQLENCNIESLEEVMSLFYACSFLYLARNSIKEIDWNMNFGTVKVINLAGCPVAEDKRNWDNNGYIRVNDTKFQNFFTYEAYDNY